MSEHSPLPWKLDKGEDLDGNPQVWHVLDAEGRFVITTDCGFYTRFEGDYDLIVNAVNSIDRLRKANEELVQLLKEIQPHIGGLSWPGRIQQALQSSESDK